MRLEHLTDDEEDFWRGEFAQENWIFGALSLSVTLPEFAGGIPSLRKMHFGYYLQPLHLNADDREDLLESLLMCWLAANHLSIFSSSAARVFGFLMPFPRASP